MWTWNASKSQQECWLPLHPTSGVCRLAMESVWVRQAACRRFWLFIIIIIIIIYLGTYRDDADVTQPRSTVAQWRCKELFFMSSKSCIVDWTIFFWTHSVFVFSFFPTSFLFPALCHACSCLLDCLVYSSVLVFSFFISFMFPALCHTCSCLFVCFVFHQSTSRKRYIILQEKHNLKKW